MDTRSRFLVTLLAVAWLMPGTASAAENDAPVEITEWDVPWENSRPRDPWVGGENTIWFVGQRSHYVARLDPESGEFRRYDLADGTGPHTVIADERGAWYAGNRAQHIGLLDPDSGEIEKIMLPGDGRRDAHTMAFTSDGDIWFTVQGGNQIGFLDTDSREITLHEVPTSGARPYGIVVDDEDRPWATLFGTHKLATVEDGQVRELDLPREDARPRRLALTGDGNIWYVDYAEGYLGRFEIDSGEVAEWRTPAAERARPYALAADDRGRPWFVETGVSPNRFVGFDPESETFTEPVEIGSGGGTVRHMVFDPERDAFWFGTDTNTIGRARLE